MIARRIFALPADVHPRKDDRVLDLRVAVDASLRTDDRPRYPAAGNDRPGADDAVVRRAAAIVRLEHELRRRQVRLIRAHRPVVVVQVEQRIDGRQLDVGLVVGVDRADVAPVGVLLAVLVAKRKRLHACSCESSTE